MKLPAFKSAAIISALLLATSACAQTSPTATGSGGQNGQTSVKVSNKVSSTVDAHLRKILTEVGIKTEIVAINPSNLPNMYQVDLAGQPPLHITADGKYVI